jgi:hypothetical protein
MGALVPEKNQHDNKKRWTSVFTSSIRGLIYFVKGLLPIVVLCGVGARLKVVRVHVHHKRLRETCHQRVIFTFSDKKRMSYLSIKKLKTPFSISVTVAEMALQS